ncbi:MAG: metal-dependent hydrolase [Candidatus Hermodarchaeia archaeon]|jgi:membrane-bound metal-dependent hydrolase YbcI (DUF457 family)
MKKETHLIFAAVVGYATVELLSFFGVFHMPGFLERAACIVLSMAGASLPDKIEKPKTYRHRGFFHSILFLACVVFLIYAFRESIYFAAFACGYASHLVTDYGTRLSIPLY